MACSYRLIDDECCRGCARLSAFERWPELGGVIDPAPSAKAVYRFGQFTLDTASGILTRRGLRVKLQEQPFQILALLLEHHGAVVSRAEIRERLWAANTFVDFDKSLGVAVLKVREALEDDAANPRFVETIPRRGYRFIAPVTATSTEDLPSSPDRSLQEEISASSLPLPQAATAALAFPAPPSPIFATSWRRYGVVAVWLGLAAVITAILAAAYLHIRSTRNLSSEAVAVPAPARTAGPQPLPVRSRRSVAVLGFRNLPQSAGNTWLSTAFSEMLNTELAAGGELRMISGEDVARVEREIALTPEASLSKTTLTRLRTSLGADVVLLGSYTLLPSRNKSRIRLDVRLQDTGLGETIHEEAFTSNEDDLFDLASHAGTHLREALSPGLRLAPAFDERKPATPSNQLAFQLYSEGRARLYACDFTHARDLLLRATSSDPAFPLAHAALAETWSHLGYTPQAQAEAKRALDLSDSLPEEEALLIRGQYQTTMNAWTDAAATYQSLFQKYPDNIDYGLKLASAQRWSDRPGILNTVAILRKLPPPLRDDLRIDMAEADGWLNTDLAKGRAAAQRAVNKATALGSTLLLARSYGILCQLDAGASVLEQTVRECSSSRAAYVSAGDLNNAARTLNDLASAYYLQGELARAESMWREAITEFHNVGDEEGISAASSNLGATLFTQGNLPGARRLMHMALSSSELIGDKDGVARALTNLGDVSLQSGDLHAAQIYYQRSTAVASTINDKSAAAFGMAGMGDVLVEQRELAAAHSFYDKAIQMRTEIGEKQAVAETRIQVARLAIDEDHAAEAAGDLRSIEQQSHRDAQPDDELQAGLMLTRALMSSSGPANAHDGNAQLHAAMNELEALSPLAHSTQNRLLAIRYIYMLALAQGRAGDSRASALGLADALKQAHAHKFTLFEQEILISVAKLEEHSGLSAASSNLAALQSSARSKGLYLLAQYARTKD